MNASKADTKINTILASQDGVDVVADALADLGSAIVDLRSAAAELAGVDRLLAAAADRVLVEAGI